MKKTTILIIALFLLTLLSGTYSKAQNQIPNADFENWSSGVPDQWDTSNTSIFGTDFTCVTRENVNPQNGTSAAKVQSVSHNIIFVGEVVMPGILTLGDVVIDILNQTGTVSGGVAVSGYPKYLKGYLKYQPSTGDSCVIGLGLTKWNGTSRDTLAFAYSKYGGSVSAWEEFTVEVRYMDFVEPDSMNIMFISSNIESGEVGAGSTLWVDNLWLEYSGVAIQDVGMDKKVFVYSANNGQSLIVNAGKHIISKLETYSINGNMIKTIVTDAVQPMIDMTDLPKGFYILRVLFAEGSSKTVKFTVL